MPLRRQDKVDLTEKYSDLVEKGSGLVAFEYHGLTVEQFNELRNKIRETGASLFVVKNRMLKRAIDGKPYSGLNDVLVGPNAVIFAGEDPIAPTKALVDYAKDHEVIKIKGGVVESTYYNASQVEALSKMPSREQLYSKILGGIKAPASNLLGCVKGMHQKLHGLMKAYQEKLEKEAA